MNNPLIWGAIGGLLTVGVWTVATVTQTTMPSGFASMQPMGLVSVGFFWGAALCMIRNRFGQGHG